MSSILPYLPVIAVVLFLNTADVYFLQTDRFPRFDRAPSYWLYILGQCLVGLAAAFLLYHKAGLEDADWPIVTMIASLTGFSLLQSWTLKFGDKGIDARELFDAWKRRVIEDVSQANTSRKRARLVRIVKQLMKLSAGELDVLVLQLAPSAPNERDALLEGFTKSGDHAVRVKAQWIASTDLEFAESQCPDERKRPLHRRFLAWLMGDRREERDRR